MVISNCESNSSSEASLVCELLQLCVVCTSGVVSSSPISEKDKEILHKIISFTAELIKVCCYAILVDSFVFHFFIINFIWNKP